MSCTVAEVLIDLGEGEEFSVRINDVLHDIHGDFWVVDKLVCRGSAVQLRCTKLEHSIVDGRQLLKETATARTLQRNEVRWVQWPTRNAVSHVGAVHFKRWL